MLLSSHWPGAHRRALLPASVKQASWATATQFSQLSPVSQGNNYIKVILNQPTQAACAQTQ